MSQSFEIFVLFIVVAALAYRLFSMLGKETPMSVPPEVQKAAEEAYAQFAQKNKLTFAKDSEEPLKEILAKFPFSVPEFVIGAKKAFEMVLSAFAKADIEPLKNLLSPKLFKTFDTEIKRRKKEKQSGEFELIRFKSVSVEHASYKGSTVSLSLLFETEQVNVLKDSKGKTVSGSTEMIESGSDTWTFEKDMNNTDSLWTIVEVA